MLHAIEETGPCSIYLQEKSSLSWMKENMGVQPQNIPEKICDKRKTWSNRIIANNK